MKKPLRAAVLAGVAAALLGGCSGRYQLNASSTTVSGGAAPGTSVSGAAVQVQSGGAAAVALIAIGVMALSSDYSRPPELAPDRRVNEQDCGKPIVDWSANLKCR
jgi:hypothetical protein